jgi:hypothetical protein
MVPKHLYDEIEDWISSTFPVRSVSTLPDNILDILPDGIMSKITDWHAKLYAECKDQLSVLDGILGSVLDASVYQVVATSPSLIQVFFYGSYTGVKITCETKNNHEHTSEDWVYTLTLTDRPSVYMLQADDAGDLFDNPKNLVKEIVRLCGHFTRLD